MTRAARPALLLALLLAPALALVPAGAPPSAVGQPARDPFDAMSVHQPLDPSPAPDLAFLTGEGHEARLGDFRGKVVLLGFFTAT